MVFIFSALISVDLDLYIVIAILLIKYIQQHGRTKRKNIVVNPIGLLSYVFLLLQIISYFNFFRVKNILSLTKIIEKITKIYDI
jgi:hypothetical protein